MSLIFSVQGGTLAVASMNDIIKLLVLHPKMTAFNVNIINAYLQYSKGAVGELAHAVQEAPISSQGLSSGCFVVPCMNASL